MLESCSYSALGETTLLTSPFLARICVSPFPLQSISYYGNNMSLPGGGVQPQPKQPRINSSTQIHILGQSPCSSAGEWEQSPGCVKEQISVRACLLQDVWGAENTGGDPIFPVRVDMASLGKARVTYNSRA